VAVIWKVFGLDPIMPMIFPALAASLVSLVGVSLMTVPPRPEQWQPFFRKAEQGK